jgi:uncharacterized DUF497 family protein
MKITFDPVKRAVTLAERGLDFEDAAELFRGDTLDSPMTAGTMTNYECLRSAIFVDAW